MSDDDPAMKLELGMALSAARRDVEAAGVLGPLLEGQDATTNSARSSACTLALAQSQFRLGRHEAARKTLDRHVRTSRDDGPAWLLLTRVACEQRDWRAARRASEEAVKRRGDAAEPHLLRAYICLQQKDEAEAVVSARLAIQRDARDATGYCLLGQGYESRGEAALARAAYFDALTHDPQSALARALLEKMGPAPAGNAVELEKPPQATAMSPSVTDSPLEASIP